ncbi:hypothetical protein FHR33_004957 [Nonomuraea dietziae]|uniref:Acetyltransferase n=1 Tax=Nonomuraea dietziae TaxID=65515 RepID=A0A7W5YQ18_9ACTN|nr:hypothetical protein [Nonomuraea dietziae]
MPSRSSSTGSSWATSRSPASTGTATAGSPTGPPRRRAAGGWRRGPRALLAEWAFAERGLFRLELGHRTNNPASCRVAVRAGFVAEGIERGKLVYDGVRYDVERHARLATD